MSAQEHTVRRHRLTIDEYYRMGAVGILAPEARVELINGEIIDMAPIGNDHMGVVNHLTDLLTHQTRSFAIVQVQGPLKLGQHSVPQPDLLLLRRRADFYRGGSTVDDVLLVIEVSDTTVRYDRRVKVRLYAEHGVPEMWMFDLPAHRLHVFSDPRDGEYQSVTVLDRPGEVTLAARPCTIDLSGVL